MMLYYTEDHDERRITESSPQDLAVSFAAEAGQIYHVNSNKKVSQVAPFDPTSGHVNMAWSPTVEEGLSDYIQAMHWYNMAADKRNSEAMNSSAYLHLTGFSQALTLFKKREPNTGDMFNIGTMYENGLGVDRDLSQANQWYQKAYQKAAATKNTSAMQWLSEHGVSASGRVGTR